MKRADDFEQRRQHIANLTDEELYKKYNLTDEEIQLIESMIKPME